MNISMLILLYVGYLVYLFGGIALVAKFTKDMKNTTVVERFSVFLFWPVIILIVVIAVIACLPYYATKALYQQIKTGKIEL